MAFNLRASSVFRLSVCETLSSSLLRTYFTRCSHTKGGGSMTIPPPLPELMSPDDMARARSWVTGFQAQVLPRELVQFTFSRSSGPGGQNVNKVNTKATLRCAVDSHWIPMWARKNLRNSSFYVGSTKSILMSSTVFRSQSQNVDDCLSKLHALILSASSASIKNEPNQEQKERVRGFKGVANAKRKVQKNYRSEIKKGRTFRPDDS